MLWALVQLCLYEAVYIDAPNKRCFSWSNDVLQLRACWSPGDATNLVETSCYLFGRNNCTRKQHTLKAVEKVSRNKWVIFMSNYSPQAQKLLPAIKLDRWPRKRHARSQYENEVEVRTDTITSSLASLAHSNDVFGLEPCWCNSTHLNVLCRVSRKTPTWLSETLQRCTVNPSSSKLNKCVAKFS